MTVYLTKYGWKPETRVVNDEVITTEEMKIREVLSLKEKYLSQECIKYRAVEIAKKGSYLVRLEGDYFEEVKMRSSDNIPKKMTPFP